MKLFKVKGRDRGANTGTSLTSALRILFFCTLAATIAAIFYLAKDIYSNIYAAPAVKPKQLPPLDSYSATATQAPSNQLKYLDEFFFFGREVVAPEPQKTVAVKNMPRTRLNIQLTGVLAHPETDKSLAIVSVSGQQQTLMAGQSITNTPAVIERVLSDRIVVQHQGKQEVVLLRPDDKLSGVLATTSDSSINTSETDTTPAAPSSLDDVIQLTAIRDGDAITGYRVSAGKFSSIYEKAGFTDQDIAIAIDGMDLTDAELADEILTEIGLMQSAEITVERGNQQHLIQLSI